ncbi:MAG: CvpA family protein [Acutalibacteraceae bacterium]|nr:CvpA family protein [Acutalibacteraceae bacterium]
MFKKYGLPAIITLILGAGNYYLSLPALNIKSASLWGFVLFLVIVYFVSMGIIAKSEWLTKLIKGKKVSVNSFEFERIRKYTPKKVKIIVLSIVAVVVVVGGAIFVSSSQFFNASKYQKMLTVTESSFNEDIAEIPLSQIPVVDRDTASRLGSRKIGEVVELVSQFNVSDYYTQINYNNHPTRVSPLEYADIIKWFTNRDDGIPYYVKIDMASQDTELVDLPEGMKYSPSEVFSRDLMRHVRFAYPTKMFDSTSFEIDEKGHPYWIISCYDFTIGFLGGYDITGIIMVDAVTGDMTYYDVSDVPTWIDCVYKADVVLQQANYWGSYVNGYWNSIISQKNVVKTTEGYNYLAIDDDIWVYTGITSVVSDESNIGFILVNLRTKETKTYSINGAEEYSAMESAEGKIQEKGYTATFPILVNIADTPSYFISLKDSAGLVKAYSFVSVSNYQIVGVADTVAGAEQEYRRLLRESGKLNEEGGDNTAENKTVTGVINAVSTAVINGNTAYYIVLENNETVFIADVSLNDRLPFVTIGDTVEITYNEFDGDITVTGVKLTAKQ